MIRVLDTALGAIVAAALGFTVAAIDKAYPCDLDTAMAVNVAYTANDTVQKAIDADICHRGVRPALSPTDQASYAAIDKALGDAYRESEGTDSAMEQVEHDFCYAMGER